MGRPWAERDAWGVLAAGVGPTPNRMCAMLHATPPPPLSRASRVLCVVLALLAAAPLVVAAGITPSKVGHGTHTQLGMPPCGWAIYFRKPCMTCGMTTAFAHAVRLEPLEAAKAQPAGLVIAFACGVAFWALLLAGLLSWNLARPARVLLSTRVLVAVCLLLLGAWAYKYATWAG
jgi:hypothetical protein